MNKTGKGTGKTIKEKTEHEKDILVICRKERTRIIRKDIIVFRLSTAEMKKTGGRNRITVSERETRRERRNRRRRRKKRRGK